MLVNNLVHPLTAGSSLEKVLPSRDRESCYYRGHSRLSTTPKQKVMNPNERLPGVSQLLTPVSPTHYGRSQHYRDQDQNFGDRPASHRSSLPLEDILCPVEPPISKNTSSNPSPFYSPSSQASAPFSRGDLSTSQMLPSRSCSFTSVMAMHQGHAVPQYSDIYQYQPQQRPRRGSVETSRTSGSSGASSIPPPSQARLVGEQHFPGEGLCWVYDDGTHIRKEIDGETVNPQWGVTKAGKPRKRLAQACLTCREKKIKCDLADPKCLQCDKSGRECRYASA